MAAKARSDEKAGPRLPPDPHDALFRTLLEDPSRAAVLIREHLPDEVRQQLSDAPPRLLDGTYVDERLRTTRSDRLFEMRLRTGRPVFVYVLLEHKSSPDPRTPLQLLGYMVRIWERHAEGDAAKLGALPPIVPLVFYHGVRPWRVPRSIFEMIERNEALDPLVRSMAYVLRDLGRIETERLSRDPAVRAVLAVLKYVQRSKEIDAEILAGVLRSLPRGLRLAVTVMRYIVATYQIDRTLLDEAARLAGPGNWETLMGTIAEEWIQEGRQEGRQEGEASALARLLERRFGVLPDAARERIAAASLEQLDAWFDAAIDAESPKKVFDA